MTTASTLSCLHGRACIHAHVWAHLGDVQASHGRACTCIHVWAHLGDVHAKSHMRQSLYSPPTRTPVACPCAGESVQFVSGLATEPARAREESRNQSRWVGGALGGMAPGRADGERLMLSVGINDCEAKIARIPMADVWRSLLPLSGEVAACEY